MARTPKLPEAKANPKTTIPKTIARPAGKGDIQRFMFASKSRLMRAFTVRRWPNPRVYAGPTNGGRSLPVVDSHSNDLAFGRRRVPGSPSFAAPEQFAAIASKQPVVLIVHRRRLDAYRHQLGKLGLHHRARIGPVNIYTRD